MVSGKIASFFTGFQSFLASARRVIVISTKPEWKEYIAMAKVTGIGIIIIGIIGFVLQLVFSLLGIGF